MQDFVQRTKLAGGHVNKNLRNFIQKKFPETEMKMSDLEIQ